MFLSNCKHLCVAYKHTLINTGHVPLYIFVLLLVSSLFFRVNTSPDYIWITYRVNVPWCKHKTFVPSHQTSNLWLTNLENFTTEHAFGSECLFSDWLQFPEDSLVDDSLLQDDDEEEDDNESRSWRRWRWSLLSSPAALHHSFELCVFEMVVFKNLIYISLAFLFYLLNLSRLSVKRLWIWITELWNDMIICFLTLIDCFVSCRNID